MFYIVETENQLARLEAMSTLGCYLDVVTSNDNYHPALTSVVAIYIRPFALKVPIDQESPEIVWDHGYIIPIEHNEGLCVPIEKVFNILKKYSTVYVLNKKKVLYHFALPKAIDISLLYSMTEFEKLEVVSKDTTYNWFYSRYGNLKNVNQVIPLTKIFERCENTFEQVKKVFSFEEPEGFDFYNNLVVPAFFLVEQNGIRVDTFSFEEMFKPTCPSWSIVGETVYSQYNLYNTTGRPTNSFNAVNFVAIPKGEEFRRVFKPQNDYFCELDFDGYHVRLVASLLKYKIPTDIKAHKYLGKLYYGRDEITEEEYRNVKGKNFQAIYGTIPEECKDIDFFRKLKEFVDSYWETFVSKGVVEDPVSHKQFTKKLKEMRPTKLMNYLVQSLETSRNAKILKKVLAYLLPYKTKVILVTYDSFLLDVSEEDPEDVVENVKKIMEVGGFPVHASKSRDLNFK